MAHSQTRWLSRHAWQVYGAACAVFIAVYFWLPPADTRAAAIARVVTYLSVGVLASVAMVVGIRWHRPAIRRAWWLLFASQLAYVGADATFYVRHYVLHLVDFPSYADVLYLLHPPLAIAALLVLVRRRQPGGDRAGLAEAGIVSVSAALLSWVYLVVPNATSQGTFLVKVVSVIFPVLDLGVAVVCVRLITTRERLRSTDLLLATFGLIIVADSVYGLLQLGGTYTSGNVVDAIWLASYACLGMAALHPSMRLVAAHPVAPRPATTRRILALVPAAVLPPCLLIAEYALHGGTLHPVEIGLATVAEVALVTWRMLQLVSAQRAAMEELASLERQKAALLERTMQVGEMERTRVAIELHDGPIQRLAAVAYVIDASAARAVTQPEAAYECLLSLRERVTEEVQGLRRIMAELRPPVLDHGGLTAALRDYLDDFAEAHGVTTGVTSNLDETPLDPKVEIVVYRVVQEALANVAKHAQARRVDVDLRRTGSALEVRVRDDGVGFDPAAARVRDHFGLDAMRERLANVGGAMDVVTRRGDGTAIVGRLDLSFADAA